MQKQTPLNSFRTRFFPVHNNELLGFFLLSLCFFCVAFQYAALRGCKDALVFGLPKGGAEVISACKIMVIVFMILFKVMYDFMAKHVNKYHRLNYVFGYFILFFLIATLFLYPNRDKWQIIGLTNTLNNTFLLNRFWPLWVALRNWPLALIYMHAECVGSFGLGVSLWGIANYISTIDQSKRIYPLFSFFAGFATFIAGRIVKDPETFPINGILNICIASFFALLLIYNLFIRVVKNRPEVYTVGSKPKKKKVKMGLKESFAVLFKSRYCLGITLLVLGYAVSIVLFENIYRDVLKQLAQGIDPSKIKEITRSWGGTQLEYIGLFQMVCVWIAPYIMRKKWRFGASIVPVIMLTGTLVLLSLIFFAPYLPWISTLNQLQLMEAITWTGLIIIVIVKTQKYMSFDPTKEMLYIPLSDGEKGTLKSAVDGVSSRLGKGGAAVIVTFLVVPIFGSVRVFGAKLFLGLLILLILSIWLLAIKDVSRQFSALLKKKDSTKELKMGEDKNTR